MDEGPSSDRPRVRARTLVQGSVILAIGLALWLMGGGPRSTLPQPLEAPLPLLTTPALTSAGSPQLPGPTRIDLARAMDGPTSALPSVQALPTSTPDQLVGDGASLAALAAKAGDLAPVLASPSQPFSPPEESPQDVAPQDLEPQTASPQDDGAPGGAGGGALPQEATSEVAGDPEGSGGPKESGGLGELGTGIAVPSGYVPFAPTPESPPDGPTSPETTHPWVWPVRGEISQGYSSGHRAIDLSTEHGAVVVAADAGTVVYARWEISGYGYLVIVDHHNGFVSYYGHLYGFYIDVGHEVARGEQIGELGTTGRSTGPHLHFEIRQDGVQRNPLDLLP